MHVYRVSAVSWALGRRLMHVDNFAMPNLIAGKVIVPELIQHAGKLTVRRRTQA